MKKRTTLADRIKRAASHLWEEEAALPDTQYVRVEKLKKELDEYEKLSEPELSSKFKIVKEQQIRQLENLKLQKEQRLEDLLIQREENKTVVAPDELCWLKPKLVEYTERGIVAVKQSLERIEEALCNWRVLTAELWKERETKRLKTNIASFDGETRLKEVNAQRAFLRSQVEDILKQLDNNENQII